MSKLTPRELKAGLDKISAMDDLLLEMLEEQDMVRIDEAGLIAYVKDDQLYLEWDDGFVICRSIEEIRRLQRHLRGPGAH